MAIRVKDFSAQPNTNQLAKAIKYACGSVHLFELRYANDVAIKNIV